MRNPEAKSPLGGPRCRWENVKMDLRNIWWRSRDWIYLAQSSEHGKELNDSELGWTTRVRYPKRVRFFPFSIALRWVPWLSQSPVRWVPGALSGEVQRQVDETDAHLHLLPKPSIMELRTNSIPYQYVFMAWCLINYRHNIAYMLYYYYYYDRLCGLVVRVPVYRSRGPGSIPGATRFSEK
jgi:hypothetical protein